MKQVYKIDETGFFREPVIVNENEMPDDCVPEKWKTPLYKPKWNGTEWIEGLTQAEIDILNATPSELEIERLKTELSETDYKTIKCSEYQLAGQELPYDVADLHTERQALRDRINELESTLA